MSYPNIPDIQPNITITREQVVNLLLASIGMEELGLAHIINSEAEKIQYVIGTLSGQTKPFIPTTGEILTINDSVEKTLTSVIKKGILLGFKLDDVIQIPEGKIIIHKNIASVIATFASIQLSDSDIAYYHTEEGLDDQKQEVMV